MNHILHLLQTDNQHDPNGATPTHQKPTPPGPPPMVLQNPLPHQGMVETQPLVPQTFTTTSTAQPIDPGVYQLMKLSSDVNL